MAAGSTRVLEADEWQQRRDRHVARVDAWLEPHLDRRRRGEPHPVEDFLFTYYSFRPAALRRWHPGFGVVLTGGHDYAEVRGYAVQSGGATVTRDHLRLLQPRVKATGSLLRATRDRQPSFGCFGLHEWAMVHGAAADEVRHAGWPLRLGGAGTDAVVEEHRITCSHFDAYRFFTASARPMNTLRPGADDRAELEQPACLHAGMDLYKHAYRLCPLVPSELVADCFELARDIRVLDMRASPYDLSGLGYRPVPIETAEGKQEYVAGQREFVQRAAPLRRRLIEECARLLAS